MHGDERHSAPDAQGTALTPALSPARRGHLSLPPPAPAASLRPRGVRGSSAPLAYTRRGSRHLKGSALCHVAPSGGTSCLSEWRRAHGAGAAVSSSCLIAHRSHLSASRATLALRPQPSSSWSGLPSLGYSVRYGSCVESEEASDLGGGAGGIWVSGSFLWAW